MQINISKVHKILQYILCVAGQREGWERELSAIHLIKYVYLVDLDHAARNNGETYTGIPWCFHHYGPWSTELFLCIDPALAAINACKKKIEYSSGDTSEKWIADGCQDYDQIDLALSVEGSIQKYMRKFKNDTAKLLHAVYNTKPMLNAAPGEMLDFHFAVEIKLHEESKLTESPLTKRQEKKKAAKKKELKHRIAEKIKAKQQRKLRYVNPKPRYDDVFFEGLECIDRLNKTNELDDVECVLEISSDIWKSDMRKASDEL